MREETSQAHLPAPGRRALGRALPAGGWDFKPKCGAGGVPPIPVASVTHKGSSAGGMKGLHLAEPNDLGADTPPAPLWRSVGQQESPPARLWWLSTKEY